MKISRYQLSVAFLISFAAMHMQASTPARSTVDTSNISTTTAKTAVPKPDSAAQSAGDHVFRVNDEKGPLLDCIAPKMDTDPNTDEFQHCALAPGRTLDDVMHTFVGAIHFEQNRRAQERAEWQRQLEEKDGASTAATPQR